MSGSATINRNPNECTMMIRQVTLIAVIISEFVQCVCKFYTFHTFIIMHAKRKKCTHRKKLSAMQCDCGGQPPLESNV